MWESWKRGIPSIQFHNWKGGRLDQGRSYGIIFVPYLSSLQLQTGKRVLNLWIDFHKELPF